MNVSIQCFGQLRTITKERYVKLKVEENSSILHVITCFKDKFGDKVERLLFNDGKLREFYFIQIDNTNIDIDKLDEIIVSNDQIISIIPFVAGG